MCSIDYCDAPAVYNKETRVARREHHCCECNRIIRVGERYEYVRGLWDHRWDIFKTCRHCLSAGVWLNKVCGGYSHGGLYEELAEHRDEWAWSVTPRWLHTAVACIKRRWAKADSTLMNPMGKPKIPMGMVDEVVA